MSEMVKCLVWDLDNTLWKGTLLEGDEVTLDEEIRHVIQTLDGRGILQSISSKNDPDLAEARLAELGIAEYFVCPHIGWEPKSQAIRAIAEELNFALTAMAFVDDQPAERAEVMYHVPDVRCYSADEIATLVELPEFNPLNVTEDASRRRVMYQAAARRDAARSDFTGPDEDFLRSLELAMRIQRADENQLARVQELTLRTSQMNATGVHYSDTVLRQLVNQEEHEVLVASLTDRFGTHGAIGVVLLEKHSQVWHLKFCLELQNF